MLTVKEAAQKAIEYFEDLYKDTNYNNVALEEIELSEQEVYWFVTLGFNVFTEGQPRLLAMKRQYKVFTIYADSGELISVKMRII